MLGPVLTPEDIDKHSALKGCTLKSSLAGAEAELSVQLFRSLHAWTKTVLERLEDTNIHPPHIFHSSTHTATKKPGTKVSVAISHP